MTVIERLPFEKYVMMPGVHATALRNILVSPKNYRSKLVEERKDTDTLRVGRAGHTAVLEPDRFLLEYNVWRADEEGNTRRRAGKDWKAFCDANQDKTIITEAQYETALEMRDAVREHPVASELLKEDGRNELTIEWTHEPTGFRCKSRIDRLCSSLIDVKTTRNPDPDAFSRDAGKYGYPMQLAFYRAAARAAGIDDRPVKILAVQNVAPFDVVVFELDDEILHIGEEQFEAAMIKLADCTGKKQWLGIAPFETVPLRLPAWMSPSAEDEPLTVDGVPLF